MKSRSRLLASFVGMALSVIAISCGGGGSTSGGTSTPAPAAPTIISFVGSPSTITAGASANLTGVFANGTGSVSDSVDSTIWTLGSAAAMAVTPAVTTTYTLTVTNSVGTTVTKTTTVTVTNPASPTITSFTANPTSITAGGTATLTGVFANGAGVITPGNMTAASGVGIAVSPSATTTYTLTVTDALGVAVIGTATVTVTPSSPAQPTITSFTANPTTIVAGSSANLAGVFSNGTGVITPGNLSVTSGTAVNVTPAANTTYTLTVTPDTGQPITRTVTVTVLQLVPVANAGPDQLVGLGPRVWLDGSKSTGKYGGTPTYTWTLSTVPSGSTAMLTSRNAVQPDFIANMAGTYVAILVVSDGGMYSSPSIVHVVCVNDYSQLLKGAELSASYSVTNGVYQALYGLQLTNKSSHGFNLTELLVQGNSASYSNTDASYLNGGTIASGQSLEFLVPFGAPQYGLITARFELHDPATNISFSVIFTFPA